MRRLSRSVTGIALVALLGTGCGSTAGDRLILRFLGFNSTGITQEDAVRETSADVDVRQDCCTVSADGQFCEAFEPFKQTFINATFRNEQGADIHLERYTVDVGPRSGIGVFNGTLSSAVVGGRCTGNERQCALDADCTGTGGNLCTHTDTTVSGILLFDFDVKARVIAGTHNVVVTFFGVDDLKELFQTSTSYVVRFDGFDNCPSSGSGA